MISFDGFRSDYLDWYDTPNMDDFMGKGVRSEGLIPVFVSKTFPNHYSIATGLYAENHGLIGNSFYDSILEDKYSLSDRSKVEDPRFYEGEPIWVTAEKQGVQTASYFWVGSEAPINNTYPTRWKRYEHELPFDSRIDSVLSWLSMPKKKRPRLCLLYFHEPDHTGHETGPKSDETAMMVNKLDSLLGIFMEKLEKLSIFDKLNIVIVSDHGMTEISSERTVNLADHIDISKIKQEGSGPYSLLYDMEKNQIKTIVNQLNKSPNINAYAKKDIPERFHFKKHHRIKDILVLADEGWYINNQSISSSSEIGKQVIKGGTHGYDNQLKSMHALFIAKGPSFKEGVLVPPFENINIYPMICHILNITPNKNIDGNLKKIIHIFNI
ncbi:MAG: ectonucleotide pyrophosphatase/phosphodiesterase [Candidatus Neomarinimicrobiota bacterium]